MIKSKIMLVIPHMTIGGVQKTLISALKAIDYDKYDVTLYLRKNRTQLLKFVDERVKVIVNEDPNRYYRKLFAIALQCKSMIYKLWGQKEKSAAADRILADRIREAEMEYEKKAYFSNVKYDEAIAYVQGYTALFVDKCINADKKIIFYHTSTNDLPEIHKEVLPRFNKIAALHEEQRELIGEWYPEHRDKIQLVENYTDRALILSQSREYEVANDSGVTVLCSCGRFAPVKGFDLAAEAARLLRDKGVEFIWYFVGDGPERPAVEQLISKYNLQSKVVFTGMKENPYPYMLACDIYVQPSYQEAMPVTIIEAHRLNRPVVTTATVGGAKLVSDGENGAVCDIGAQALADTVETLIKNKKLFDNIKENLAQTDYSREFEKYKQQWKELLE